MSYLKGHWQLLILTGLVFVLWTTPVIYPLRLMVVFLHELSHGAAAVLTGGRIVEISLSAQEGGHAITQGGSRFLILTAGYLGSILIGLALFIAALRSRADRAVMAAFGLLTLAVAAFYIRDLFALGFTVALGLALLAAARFLGHDWNDLALRLIGLTSLIYVPYDIFSDTIQRSHLRSDAFMLAEEFGGPTMLWGGLWLILSLAAILACLRWGLGAASNIPLRRLQR